MILTSMYQYMGKLKKLPGCGLHWIQVQYRTLISCQWKSNTFDSQMTKLIYTFKAKGGHKSKKSSNLNDDGLKKVANSSQGLGQIKNGVKEMKEIYFKFSK